MNWRTRETLLTLLVVLAVAIVLGLTLAAIIIAG